MQGQERLKEDADHSMLIGGSLVYKAILGDCETSIPLHSPIRILKIYIETLTGFSHIQMVSTTHLKTTSLGLLVLGKARGNAHSKDRGGGEKPLIAVVQLLD